MSHSHYSREQVRVLGERNEIISQDGHKIANYVGNLLRQSLNGFHIRMRVFESDITIADHLAK